MNVSEYLLDLNKTYIFRLTVWRYLYTQDHPPLNVEPGPNAQKHKADKTQIQTHSFVSLDIANYPYIIEMSYLFWNVYK